MILVLRIPRPVASAVPVVFVIVFAASLIVRSGCSQLSPRYDPLIARFHQPSALRGNFERTLNTVGKPVLDRCKKRGLLGLMASSRGKRATHSTTPTLLNSARARGQHRCNSWLGEWTHINIKERNREQSVIMCVIVGDVPNSGYMLRFTQEHACLRISTKPVDMPEDSSQTPHFLCTHAAEYLRLGVNLAIHTDP